MWLAIWLAGIAVAGREFGLQLRVHGWNWCAFAAPLIALCVDWRESVLNHRVALEPDGAKAERRMVWMEVCLGIRLFAIGAFTAGIVIAIAKVWSWLLHGAPLPEVLWLLGLDAGMLYFGASAAWCAAAMNDAGLGSIVQLQNTRTPAEVVSLLSTWAAGGINKMDKRFLMPVVRTIWRDILAFIPAYSVVLFIGSWLALSLTKRQFFASGDDHLMLGLLVRAWWVPAAAGTLLCALADYVEDAVHLSYITSFPEAPSRGAVWVATTATRTKLALAITGILAVCGAAILLGWKQLQHVRGGETGGLSVILVVATALIFYFQLRNFISSLKNSQAE